MLAAMMPNQCDTLSRYFVRDSRFLAASYPSPYEWWEATRRQAARAARSFDLLRGTSVPVYPGPLVVPDDDEVVPQLVTDVLRRIAVLWAVALRGDGETQEEASA